jgi:hypothetical protein
MKRSQLKHDDPFPRRLSVGLSLDGLFHQVLAITFSTKVVVVGAASPVESQPTHTLTHVDGLAASRPGALPSPKLWPHTPGMDNASVAHGLAHLLPREILNTNSERLIEYACKDGF